MCETEPSAERQGQHTAGEGKIYVNKCVLLFFIMPSNRAAILSTYRDLLELLRRLPSDLAAARKADAAAQIRAAATAAPPLADASADGLKRLMAAVATLRATTARVPGERRGGRGGVYVLREGRLVEEVEGDRGASTSR